MKTKLLTAAIAAGSVLGSTSVLAAADSGSDALRTTLGNATLTAEGYGGYTNYEEDNVSSKQELSDFDFDKLRIGLNGTIKEDVTFGFELEWVLNDADFVDNVDGNSNDENDLNLNDLYVERAFGTTIATLGRFKQLNERANSVEMRDHVFDGGNAFSDADRRVDGAQVRHSNETGLHASGAVYKGGVNDESASGDVERDRNFGYSASLGWIGSVGDGITLGGTFSGYQEDGNESEAAMSDFEWSGYALEAVIGVGPVVGGLTWSTNEQEGTSGGTPNVDFETEHTSLWAAWNLSNAGRTFNEYGVLQGPSVNAGDLGYEVAIRYGMGEDENKLSSFKEETDFWAIAFNLYCGSHTKWFAQISQEESEDDATGATMQEIDVIRLGGRFAF